MCTSGLDGYECTHYCVTMYTGNGTSGDRRTPAATPVITDATSHNNASTAEKTDALSAMTVGELFRESAARHLDPIKVLGGFSSFPETCDLCRESGHPDGFCVCDEPGCLHNWDEASK